MTTIAADSSDLDLASVTVPTDVPITMVNLVRFKRQADYGDKTDEVPCSGEEAYMVRYALNFGRVVARLGLSGVSVGVPVFLGVAHAHIVAPREEKWDMVLLVEYPSIATFRLIAESKEYEEECEHHRLAALENWRLICTTKVPFPMTASYVFEVLVTYLWTVLCDITNTIMQSLGVRKAPKKNSA